MVLGDVALLLERAADVDGVGGVEEAGALVPAHDDAVGAIKGGQVEFLVVDHHVVALEHGGGLLW